MKVLVVGYSYPPVAGPGLERMLELASSLPALGIETHVLAPDDEGRSDPGAAPPIPTQAWVHRAHYVGPGAGGGEPREAEGRDVLAAVAARARALGRRALQPDEGVTWNVTAVPAAVRLVRQHGIDWVVTVAPPQSLHLVGAAVKRLAGAAWLADLAERPGEGTAWLVARQADAIACGSEEIAAAMRARGGSGPVVSIPPGDDASSTANLLRSLA